jgi:hypothetical protein
MQRVATFHVASQREYVPRPDAFQFNAKAGWVRLQRLCFWFLAKIGAYDMQAVVSYKRVDLNLDDVVRATLEHEQNIYTLTHRKGKYLVVGNKQWMELAKQAADQFVMFPFPPNYRANIHPREHQNMFAGMKIVVVPWIDGLFVLPDLEKDF